MKWFKRILLSLVALAALVIGTIHVWGGIIIAREYAADPRNVLLSSRPDVLATGERLAQVYGCHRGCHGENLEGLVFFEEWGWGRIVAPNLTRAMDRYSTGQLEAIIRQGVRPDGTSIMAMPSASFATMTDRDLSAILSFIGAYPEQDQDLGRSRYGLMPRAMLILGQFEPAAVAAAQADAPWAGDFRYDPLRLGEYLAMNACSECHGMELEGNEGFAPPLVFAKGYSMANFRKLLSTGEGVGDRDLGLMSQVAKARFSLLTAEEVEALYQYLSTR